LHTGFGKPPFSAAVQSAEKNDSQEKRDISAFSVNSLQDLGYRLSNIGKIALTGLGLDLAPYFLLHLLFHSNYTIKSTLSIQAELHYMDTSWARQIMLS
jgi:hypothetical protein